MQGSLVIKSGTTFSYAMQQIHEEKPAKVNIDGRDYTVKWLEKSVEVSRSDCPWHSGFTETIPRYWEIEPGTLVWDASKTRSLQMQEALVNLLTTPPTQVDESSSELSSGSEIIISDKPKEKAPASPQQSKEIQAKCANFLVEINGIEKASSILVGKELCAIPTHVPAGRIGSMFEAPVQKVQQGMQEFDRLSRRLNAERLTLIKTLEKLTREPRPFTRGEENQIRSDIKGLGDYTALINQGRETYVTICKGYLTESRKTAHVDLAMKYLTNLSRFADQFKQTSVGSFPSLVTKHVEHKNSLAQLDSDNRKLAKSIDAHMNTMRGDARENFVALAGNHLKLATAIAQMQSKSM